jgi:predicted DNA-binding protein (UPF0251 family)
MPTTLRKRKLTPEEIHLVRKVDEAGMLTRDRLSTILKISRRELAVLLRRPRKAVA